MVTESKGAIAFGDFWQNWSCFVQKCHRYTINQ